MAHPDSRFKVREVFNGFVVEDTVTGQEASLGDGVDTLFDDEGNALSPGTPGFTEYWENSLNDDWGMVLYAYFPNTYKAENEVGDRSTVECGKCHSKIELRNAFPSNKYGYLCDNCEEDN